METTLRKADRLVLDLFKNLVIINDEGISSKVPVIYGTREKLRARAEGTGGIKKIAMPIVAMCRKDIHQTLVPTKTTTWLLDYHVLIETLFQEDMNQILEQMFLHFSPKVEFEDNNVKKLHLRNITSNDSEERGNGMHVLSYELLMQAEVILKKQGDNKEQSN